MILLILIYIFTKYWRKNYAKNYLKKVRFCIFYLLKYLQCINFIIIISDAFIYVNNKIKMNEIKNIKKSLWKVYNSSGLNTVMNIKHHCVFTLYNYKGRYPCLSQDTNDTYLIYLRTYIFISVWFCTLYQICTKWEFLHISNFYISTKTSVSIRVLKVEFK